MKKLAAIGILSATLCASAGATDWSAADYDLYPGDFDGEGKTDMLYVAKDVSKASGIARSDGSGPNEPYQTWPSNAFGIPRRTVFIRPSGRRGPARKKLLTARSPADRPGFAVYANALTGSAR